MSVAHAKNDSFAGNVAERQRGSGFHSSHTRRLDSPSPPREISLAAAFERRWGAFLIKHSVFGLAAIAAMIGTPALAADMPLKAPPVPAWAWTGFYVGGNMGGHWGNDNLTFAPDTGWAVAPGSPAAFAQLPGLLQTSLKPQGVIGGVQGGYNWQTNNIVLGFEADADWAGGSASRSLTLGPAFAGNPDDVATNKTRETFLGTVRGRLGWTTGDALFYGTGGLAVGTLSTTDTFCAFGCVTPPTDFTSGSGSTTRAGWTGGVGAEYHFRANWSAKVEYLYVDLGSFNATIPSNLVAPAQDITVSHHFADNLVRGGINFHF
jgi:outer membrane immunogenic protein